MEVVRRGTKSGHTDHLLAYDQEPAKLFEPFLITMDDDSERYPTFQHPGTVPHGSERLVRCPIMFLSAIVYPQPAA